MQPATKTGSLRKMAVRLDEPVTYKLRLNEAQIPLNPLLGKTIALHYTGNIYCIHCGRKTKKSFQQGYCYPCFMRLAECDFCIIHPEKCHYAQGTCRDDDWAHAQCMQPHVVYLANASGIKVGITRLSQIPTRWIDQGAIQALPIYQVQNRLQSGLIEVELAKIIADKTNWRKMLAEVKPQDLLAKRQEIFIKAQAIITQVATKIPHEKIITLTEEKVINIHYPVLQYPSKISALNFDKNPNVSGKLLGVKGQYLILNTGVLNVRKFGGYEVQVSGFSDQSSGKQ